jgi:zinc and cadmium transporter
MTALEMGLRFGLVGSSGVLFGDSFNNFVDGIIIGTAFVMDTRLGVVTGIAILAHDIPQEVGDFALLLEDGISTGWAVTHNLLSAATTLPGIIVGVRLAGLADVIAGLALALAAGGFIYVALADLVPRLHKRIGPDSMAHEVVPIAVGIGTIWTVQALVS